MRLEALRKINKEDNSAEFSVNKIFLDNEYELQLQNMKKIDFPNKIKIHKQYFLQNGNLRPTIFVRRSVMLPNQISHWA